MPVTFTSTILQAEGMSATGIPVPDSAVAELGSTKNPQVTIMLRAVGSSDTPYVYRASIATRNGAFIMSFSSANRAASGFGAGDEVEVTIELDTTPRTIELPEDLTSALTAAGALDRFVALSYSKQRAYVEPVTAAKAADTRQRRIEKIVNDFAD